MLVLVLLVPMLLVLVPMLLPMLVPLHWYFWCSFSCLCCPLKGGSTGVACLDTKLDHADPPPGLLQPPPYLKSLGWCTRIGLLHDLACVIA